MRSAVVVVAWLVFVGVVACGDDQGADDDGSDGVVDASIDGPPDVVPDVMPDGIDPEVTATAPSAPSGVTADATIELTGTAADASRIVAVTWTNTTSGASGTATGTTSWSATVPLVVGENAIVVTAVDGSTESSIASLTVTRDDAGPTLTIASPAGAIITAANATAAAGSAADPSGIASVAWTNTTAAMSGVAVGTTSWSIDAIPLATGANAIAITATDSVGNATSVTVTVRRDAAPPGIAITEPTTDPTYSTPLLVLTIGGTASDDTELTSVSWTNNANATSGVATGTTAWTASAIALVPGENVITVTATDAVGSTTTDSLAVTRDVPGPTITITSPTASPTFATSTATTALAGTASAAAGLTSVAWTNATTSSSGTATGTTSWSVGSIALATGPNTIEVTATDAVGATSTDSLIITRDSTAPVVAITSPTAAATLTVRSASLTLGGTASDVGGLVSVAWRNSTSSAMGIATGTSSWTASDVPLAVGSNVLIVTATDIAGNTSTDSLTVTRDIDGPTVAITTPTTAVTFATAAATINMAGIASDPAGVATVTWTNSATGGTGTATGTTSWSVTSLALAAGTNPIVVTATDSVGNTTTDTLAITRDIDGPTIAFTSPSAGPAYASPVSTIAIAGTASDPAGVTSVTWTNTGNGETGTVTGTTTWSIGAVNLVAGGNPIVVRATDALGNVATRTLTVSKAPTPIVDVAAGWSHTCAILVGGALKCWGSNASGALGLGDLLARGDARNEMGSNLPTVDLGTGRTAVAIALGSSHSCAVLDDGSVKCWGEAQRGQLGLGDQIDRGDGPNEMGDNLPRVDLGTGRTAIAVTAGYEHTCALLDDRTVKCWGGAAFGQLGPNLSGPRGDAPNEMGDFAPAMALAGPVGELTATAYRNCALLVSGPAQCWGTLVAANGASNGTIGVLVPGVGRTVVGLLDSSGANHVCAVLDDATLKCQGENAYGELGYGDTTDYPDLADRPAASLGTGRTVVSVGGGNFHSCAILDDDSLKCWGYNFRGYLGLGDTENRGDQPTEMGNSLPNVDLGTGLLPVKVVGGSEHTCAMFENGSLKCWGYGTIGILSNTGTVTPIGDQPAELGDNLRLLDL